MNNGLIFYSHSKQTLAGQAGSKLLHVHTAGVMKSAKSSLSSQIDFGLAPEVLMGFLEGLCRFHDIGKYTIYFQRYLLKIGRADSDLKKHSRIGAYVIFEQYKDVQLLLAIFAYFILVSHHSDLTDLLDCNKKEDIGRENYSAQFSLQSASLVASLEQIEKELSINQLGMLLVRPDFKECRKEIRVLQRERASIRHYFFINYFFSLLIEADKLDASDTPLYVKQSIAHDCVDKRLQHSVNELRNRVRRMVAEKLDRSDILDWKIFTLTAPTGVGKTLTALDFALKLREKVYQAEAYLPQIIYALPFINIIEQALEEYQRTMPGAVILAHYQYADVFERGESDQEQGEGADYNRRLMQQDTWQSDVVITSFVQFFHTLIGNRNKLLKKFNHLAGAIVMLDEVQSLPLEKIPLIGASLYYLTKFLGTRIVLMTATRPQIFELAFRELLNDVSGAGSLDDEDKVFFNNGQPASLELLDDNKNIYASYRRTRIIPHLDRVLADANDFIESEFKSHWHCAASCIIVVNKVSRSISLFEAIKAYLVEQGHENPLYYLSTNIVPCHRFDVIRQLKEDLRAGRRPLLISTQVVEAGVDLNFDMGFRDVGPIDSIIQVAGRINREANPVNPEREHLPLYVVDFGDCKTIYGMITYGQSIKAMKGKVDIAEARYLELVNDYFNGISDSASFDYSRQIFYAMKTLHYMDGENISVSKFNLIEEQQNVRAVFVAVDAEGCRAKDSFLEIIRSSNKEEANLRKRLFDMHHKKDFNQRIITVPFYFTRDLGPIHPEVENILFVDKEMLAVYYDLVTGFKREKNKETHSMFF